jgi:hypothetical protein
MLLPLLTGIFYTVILSSTLIFIPGSDVWGTIYASSQKLLLILLILGSILLDEKDLLFKAINTKTPGKIILNGIFRPKR